MSKIECVLEAEDRAVGDRDQREIAVWTFWSLTPDSKGFHEFIGVGSKRENFLDDEGLEELYLSVFEVMGRIKDLILEERLELLYSFTMELDVVPNLQEFKDDQVALAWLAIRNAAQEKRPLKQCVVCRNYFQVGTNTRVIYCTEKCKYVAHGRAKVSGDEYPFTVIGTLHGKTFEELDDGKHSED